MTPNRPGGPEPSPGTEPHVPVPPPGTEPVAARPPAGTGGTSGRPRWDVVAVVALGGALGSTARYGLAVAWPHTPTGFPWATLVTNLSGCVLIGVLMQVIATRITPHRLVRPFLGTGVLGGFTTFSTYAVETRGLLAAGRPGLALGYLLGTLAGALAAVRLGMWAVDRVRSC
ncbi:fluoride efflux transporter CrcB [Micromonospora sp. HM5-17]|uniref:fluoride efflux transporter CrcB n=1 Tax=Micromonospora sp. HM5-17 TaxID=2487710 RepID=UPI001F37AE86|nr:fluoride efflux transporter CrcB [Micromonospora sp. HM5-17]